MYYAISTETYVYTGVSRNANQLGTTLYVIIAILQFVLIMVITPAQTASCINGERRNMDLLLCTKMSTFDIIVETSIIPCICSFL